MQQLLGVILFLVCGAAVQAEQWANIKSFQRARPAYSTPISGRVIGGSNATVGQFPFQVALLLEDFGFYGAGILISDTVVLTAGHCIKDVPPIEIWFGSFDLMDDDELGRVVMRSGDFYVHDEYDISIFKNDIGIIKLPSPARGENISPVRLPSRSMEDEKFVGATVRLSGWGTTSDSPNETSIPVLKFVDLVVRKNEDCAAEYIHPGELLPSVMCTDIQGGTVGACFGDSGGPLVIYEDDGVPTLLGVDSFINTTNRTCTIGNTFSAFTRVTSYLDWIETTAGITIRP